jgi:hypothetical protein
MAAALKALQTRLEAEAVSFRDIQKGARAAASHARTREMRLHACCAALQRG